MRNALFNINMNSYKVSLPTTKYAHENVFTYVYKSNRLYRGKREVKLAAVRDLLTPVVIPAKRTALSTPQIRQSVSVSNLGSNRKRKLEGLYLLNFVIVLNLAYIEDEKIFNDYKVNACASLSVQCDSIVEREGTNSFMLQWKNIICVIDLRHALVESLKESKQSKIAPKEIKQAVEDLYGPSAKLKPILGDGNCFFRAISDQLKHVCNVDYDHMQLRLDVVNYLRDMKDLKRDDRYHLGNFGLYLQRMKESGTYAADDVIYFYDFTP